MLPAGLLLQERYGLAPNGNGVAVIMYVCPVTGQSHTGMEPSGFPATGNIPAEDTNGCRGIGDEQKKFFVRSHDGNYGLAAMRAVFLLRTSLVIC